MTDGSTELRLRDLQTRSAAFRWLWVQHDAVAEMKREDSRVWSKLARVLNEEGITVTRASLRNLWLAVETEWSRAPAVLREARVYHGREAVVPARKREPPIGAAVRPRPEISPPLSDEDEMQLVSVRKTEDT